MPSYLRTHLIFQLLFGLPSELTGLMLFYPAILTQIRVVSEAKLAKVNFILMTLVALLTLMFTWHYSILCHMAINKASLIVVNGDQLLDATIVASLAIH